MSKAPDAEPAGEIVYIKTGSACHRECYHTREDCPQLQRAKRYRAVDRSVLFDDDAVCRVCAGTAITRGGRGRTRALECDACGAGLDSDGTCAFCTRFDEVFGG